jgi:hypothetical protein
MVGQVAVALGVVESTGLVKMRLRGGELSKPAQCYPQHCMGHEEQGRILLSLRDGEDLFPKASAAV